AACQQALMQENPAVMSAWSLTLPAGIDPLGSVAGLLVRAVTESLCPLGLGEVAAGHGAGIGDGLIDAGVPAIGASVVPRAGDHVVADDEVRGDCDRLVCGGGRDRAEQIERVRIPEADGAVGGSSHYPRPVWRESDRKTLVTVSGCRCALDQARLHIDRHHLT